MFVLLGVAAGNMFAYDVAEVVGLVGFVKSVGMTGMYVLWAPTLLLSFATTGAVGIWIDRVPRQKLLGWLLAGVTGLYLLILLLFVSGVPSGVLYGTVYVLADQQFFLFPIVFWTLANDVYPPFTAKRLFPVLSSGNSVGRIFGNVLLILAAGLLVTQVIRRMELLLGAIVLVSGASAYLVLRGLRGKGARGSAVSPPNARETVRETASVGLDYWRNVPAVRYMALAALFVDASLLLVEYHFLAVISRSVQAAGMEELLGLFKTGLVVTTMLAQAFVAGRLLDRLGLRAAFTGLPGAALLSVGCALVMSAITGGVLSQFVTQLTKWSWDAPVHSAFQNLIPDAKRGRVSVFIDSYVSTAGSLLGCAILAVVVPLSGANPSASHLVVLACAFVLAAMAGWWAWRVQAVYAESMLNWRFARPRRVKMLDALDFDSKI